MVFLKARSLSVLGEGLQNAGFDRKLFFNIHGARLWVLTPGRFPNEMPNSYQGYQYINPELSQQIKDTRNFVNIGIPDSARKEARETQTPLLVMSDLWTHLA